MAEGIEEGCGGRDKALMTFHPQPNEITDGGSAKWFHNDGWLDFNMFQTGHCREINLWDRMSYTYNLKPVKPFLDGESLYEDHPVCFNAKDLGTSSAYDVRKHSYINVFAGAFGQTYGCHDVWQMYAPNRAPVNGAQFFWYVAMDLPGAGQMKYLRSLVESRPMLDRVPDQSLITDALDAHDHIQATRGKDYIFIYSSQGKKFIVNTDKVTGNEINTYWYNPRNGEVKPNGKTPKQHQQEFQPPDSGYGRDWVLVIDDVSRNYKSPGTNK